jgi:hypothetical protein
MVAPEGIEPSIPKAAVSKTAAYAFRHGAMVQEIGFEPMCLFRGAVLQTASFSRSLTHCINWILLRNNLFLYLILLTRQTLSNSEHISIFVYLNFVVSNQYISPLINSVVVSDALESSSQRFQLCAIPSQLTDLKWWTSRESNPERLSANQKLSRLTTRPWGVSRESNSVNEVHSFASYQ